jgi:Lrp/AsnC family leucine-responsive transcriptional regulator
MRIDETDKAILAIMQNDAGITLSELAERVGVSASAAQRRLQRLREDKVILRDVSLLNPKLITPSVTMLVEIELERERPELLASLHLWIARSAEVQQAWCLTGRGDYTLVMVVRSVAHFDELSDAMMAQNPNIRKFTTSVVLKNLKSTLELPV